MYKISYFLIGALFVSFVSGNVVPFITPCKGTDKECIIKSTQVALPKVAVGLPELGVESADPLKIDEAVGDQGDLKLRFTDITITGASKCKVINVERDLETSTLKFEVECPLTVVGDYEIGGKILVIAVEGKDTFRIHSDNIKISVEAHLETVDGKDGKKHWSIKDWTHSYEPLEKVHIELNNLFNGNKDLSVPVEKLLDENWKELTAEIGKPIVEKFISKAIDVVSNFIAAVPADELEIA